MRQNIVIILLFHCFYTHSEFDYQTLNRHDIEVLKKYANSAYSTFPTLCNTFLIALECTQNNIEGDFVECGVASGAQIAAMAYACKKTNKYKMIHLFDSFEGIPLAGPNDDQQPGIGAITHNTQVINLNDLLISSGIAAQSVEQVKNNLLNWGLNLTNMVFHKGWFQFTMPLDANSIKKISFLRLDGDLYESTKICLEYLYPKVSKGGYIVIDDYSLTGCRKAVHEYLDKNQLKPEIKSVQDGWGPVYWQVN